MKEAIVSLGWSRQNPGADRIGVGQCESVLSRPPRIAHVGVPHGPLDFRDQGFPTDWGALAVIILALGPVSGAHLNPAVSPVDAALGGLRRRELVAYVAAHLAGAAAGVIVANLMFSLAPLTVSTHVRSSAGLWLGETVATFGPLLVIFGVARSGRSSIVPFAVGAYSTGAYFFTSSTSFANPAVTLARTLSNTFAGISPASAVPFIVARLCGAAIAWLAIQFLHRNAREIAEIVVVPHGSVSEKTAP